MLFYYSVIISLAAFPSQWCIIKFWSVLVCTKSASAGCAPCAVKSPHPSFRLPRKSRRESDISSLLQRFPAHPGVLAAASTQLFFTIIIIICINFCFHLFHAKDQQWQWNFSNFVLKPLEKCLILLMVIIITVVPLLENYFIQNKVFGKHSWLELN